MTHGNQAPGARRQFMRLPDALADLQRGLALFLEAVWQDDVYRAQKPDNIDYYLTWRLPGPWQLPGTVRQR